MRIAILTSFMYHKISEVHGEDRIIFGGAERYLVELCRLLRDLGHEPTVYQALDALRGYTGGAVVKQYDGVNVVCIPVSPSSWRYGCNTELNTVFNEMGGMADLRLYFATFMAFPHVVRPAITISHGIYWDFPQGEYRSLDEDGRREWLRRHMYGFTAPDLCVAVDSNVRRVIQAMEPGAESRIKVIPNFVDTSKFVPKPKEWEGKILYPRRLTMIRGSNDFLKASRDYPQYTYIACGQAADAKLEEDAQEWAKGTPHVSFIWRPMDEMPSVYQEADIAVVPTRAAEGLSLSLLEAMATGLPIVTTPAGGIGDAVIDGYNALVYDPNHEDLGEYIHALAQDADLRAKFAKRNREIAVESFDISIWRQRWAQVIKAFE